MVKFLNRTYLFAFFLLMYFSSNIQAFACGCWHSLYQSPLSNLELTAPFSEDLIKLFKQNQVYMVERTSLKDTTYSYLYSFDSTYREIIAYKNFVNGNTSTLLEKKIYRLDEKYRCTRIVSRSNELEYHEENIPGDTILITYDDEFILRYAATRHLEDSTIWTTDSTYQILYESYNEYFFELNSNQNGIRTYKGLIDEDFPFEFSLNKKGKMIRYERDGDETLVVEENLDTLKKYTHCYIDSSKHIMLKKGAKMPYHPEQIRMIEYYNNNLLVKKTIFTKGDTYNKVSNQKEPSYRYTYTYDNGYLIKINLEYGAQFKQSEEANMIYNEDGLPIVIQEWSNDQCMRLETHQFKYFSKKPL